MKKIIGILIIILASMNILQSKWKNSAGLSVYYDEKPYRYNESPALTFNSTNLNLNYIFDSTGLSLAYQGNLSLVPQLSNSQLSENGLNLSYLAFYGEDNSSGLYASASYGMKINSDYFEDYNNNSYGIFLSYSKDFERSGLIKAGYKLSIKNYSNNPDLSFNENVAFLGYRVFFETNTSINTELNYGYKNLSSSLFSFGGRGKGRNAENNSQSLGQITANIKIAQSLFEKTGLSLLYSQSWNTNDSYKQMLSYDPEMLFDKEIYDDVYSYESKELLLTLTQILPYDFKVQLLGYYADKIYEYSTDFAADDSLSNRKDINKGIGFNIEKTFHNSFLFINNTKVSLNYIYNTNSSNSEYFNYKNNAVNLNIKFNF